MEKQQGEVEITSIKGSVFQRKTVDIAPSWHTTAGICIHLLKKGNAMQKEVAEEELLKMATIADRYVETMRQKKG